MVIVAVNEILLGRETSTKNSDFGRVLTTDFTNYHGLKVFEFDQAWNATLGSLDHGPRVCRLQASNLENSMGPEGILHGELSHAIVGAAMKVLNTLKPGLDEKAYENALAIELKRQGVRVDRQKRFNVYYEGELVDTLVPDLIVDDLVVVDPKVVEEFTPTHLAQMTGYLAVTQLRLAMLINFKHVDLRWKRVVR